MYRLSQSVSFLVNHALSGTRLGRQSVAAGTQRENIRALLATATPKCPFLAIGFRESDARVRRVENASHCGDSAFRADRALYSARTGATGLIGPQVFDGRQDQFEITAA